MSVSAGTTTKISIIQYIVVVLATITAFGHFIYVRLAISYAGRDSWLSLALGCLGGAVISYFSLKQVANQPSKSLTTYLTSVFGKWFGGLLVLGYTAFFIFVVALTLKLLADFMSIIYPTTPSGLFILVILAIGTWAGSKGTEVLTRAMQILLPLLMILGLTASFLVAKDKDFTEILPVLYHGWFPVFGGALVFLSMFSEMIVFRVITPDVQSPNKLPKYGLVITGVIFLMFLLPTEGPIMVFGESVAKRLAFPTYSEIQFIQIQNIVERFDIAGILLWTVGSFLRVTMYLYGAVKSLDELAGAKEVSLRIPIAMVTGALTLSLMEVSREELYAFMGTIFLYICIAAGVIIPLAGAMMSAIRKKIMPPRKGARPHSQSRS